MYKDRSIEKKSNASSVSQADYNVYCTHFTQSQSDLSMSLVHNKSVLSLPGRNSCAIVTTFMYSCAWMKHTMPSFPYACSMAFICCRHAIVELASLINNCALHGSQTTSSHQRQSLEAGEAR